jgi:hypothetical protein
MAAFLFAVCSVFLVQDVFGASGCLGNLQAITERAGKEGGTKLAEAYKAYGANPSAQKGIMAVIAAEPAIDTIDPEELVNIFGHFPTGIEIPGNPLRTNEALFEAIGELTDTGADGVFRMRKGLDKTVKDLAGDFENQAKGAAFDLFIAKERGYGRVKALEEKLCVPRFDCVRPTDPHRVADIIEECPGGCMGLPGIHHENKNWTWPLTGPEDFRLAYYADEFRRDILIHAETSFEFYRLNLREMVRSQSSIIRDRLLREFDSEIVQQRLGPQAAQALRIQFESLWNSGISADLVRFY